MHPDSPLIDGAFPRSNGERVEIVVAYAECLLRPYRERVGEEGSAEVVARAARLREEWETHSAEEIVRPPLVHPENEYEFWHEIEDDALALVSDLLPEPWSAGIHPDDPGTVVIWSENDWDEEA